MHLNPNAARSLAESLDETLSVGRLHVPQQLRMMLVSALPQRQTLAPGQSDPRPGRARTPHGGETVRPRFRRSALSKPFLTSTIGRVAEYRRTAQAAANSYLPPVGAGYHSAELPAQVLAACRTPLGWPEASVSSSKQSRSELPPSSMNLLFSTATSAVASPLISRPTEFAGFDVPIL